MDNQNNPLPDTRMGNVLAQLYRVQGKLIGVYASLERVNEKFYGDLPETTSRDTVFSVETAAPDGGYVHEMDKRLNQQLDYLEEINNLLEILEGL